MKRILIIKLGALGDVVMATPLVDAIVKHHAGDTLCVLTTPPFATLFASWPALQVVAHARGGLRDTLSSLCWVRSGRYDRIYDLQSNDRSGLWCALSGARERVGNHTRYPYTHHPATAWVGQCHIFARQLEVLASVGITVVGDRPLLPQSAADIALVDSWCVRHALTTGSFVVLHAGASERWPSKIWPYYAELGQRLASCGIAIVWVGGDADRKRNAALATAVGIDATNAFTLPQLALLGQRARFAVTNDSGPMHVLSASGIPVFALFGPSNWRRNHALGQAARALASGDVEQAGNGQFAAEIAADSLARIGVEALWQRLVDEALVPA